MIRAGVRCRAAIVAALTAVFIGMWAAPVGAAPEIRVQPHNALDGVESQLWLMDAIQAEVSTVDRALAAARRVRDEPAVRRLQRQRAELERRLAELVAARPGARRLAALLRPVDAELRTASVAQSVEVLSRASGLRISTTADVSQRARLTLRARGVPLAHVLEAVASSAGLVISPDDGEGIVLSPCPALKVDVAPPTGVASPSTSAVRESTPWRTRPWSEAWVGGLYGSEPPRIGRVWEHLFASGTTRRGDLAARGATLPGRRGTAAAREPSVAAAAWSAVAPIAIAPLGGGALIVATAGRSPAGIAGVWLTTYRHVQGRLVPGKPIFQRLDPPHAPAR